MFGSPALPAGCCQPVRGPFQGPVSTTRGSWERLGCLLAWHLAIDIWKIRHMKPILGSQNCKFCEFRSHTHTHLYKPVIHWDARICCQHSNIFGKFCFFLAALFFFLSEVVLIPQVGGTRGEVTKSSCIVEQGRPRGGFI